MTIREMHIGIELGLQELNSNLYNTLQSEEKDYLLNRTIEIAYDKAGKDTLAEETVHFATSMMKDSDTWNKMYEDIIKKRLDYWESLKRKEKIEEGRDALQ